MKGPSHPCLSALEGMIRRRGKGQLKNMRQERDEMGRKELEQLSMSNSDKVLLFQEDVIVEPAMAMHADPDLRVFKMS